MPMKTPSSVPPKPIARGAAARVSAAGAVDAVVIASRKYVSDHI